MTGLTPHQAAATSIYDLICAQLTAHPDEPLDTRDFPPIKPDAASTPIYAPGLLDGVTGGHHGPTAEEVMRALETFLAHETDEADLVSILSAARAVSSIDNILRSAQRSGTLEALAEPLWAIARTSTNYEAVKWGIAIGSRTRTDLDERIDALLSFVRHAEFTLFATNALLWHAGERADIPLRLTHLLSCLGMWGRFHVLTQMERRRSLFRADEVQRELVVRAGKKTLDGRGERALAELVDLRRLMRRGHGDNALVRGLVGTMNGLLQGAASSPLDFDDPIELLTTYVNLLERLPRSTSRIDALGEVDDYLRSVLETEPVRARYDIDALEPLAHRVTDLTDALADEAILVELLNDEKLTRRACWIAKRCDKRELIPHLESMLEQDRDAGYPSPQAWCVVDAYANLHGTDARQTLREIAEVFAPPLPLPHPDDPSELRLQRQQALRNYAYWSLAVMEVGAPDDATAGAKALAHPSEQVRRTLHRTIKRGVLFGSQIVTAEVTRSAERMREAIASGSAASFGDVELVLEFGDATTRGWLFDNFEALLRYQPTQFDWQQDARHRTRGRVVRAAHHDDTPAACDLIDRARESDDERTRNYVASLDRRFGDHA